MEPAESKTEQHEAHRQNLWGAVAAAVAGAFNCHDKYVPAIWADVVLAAFDQRFPAPSLPTTNQEPGTRNKEP